MAQIQTIAIVLATTMIASPGQAASYLFTASGTAGSLFSFDANLNPVANPAATIAPGDAISTSFVFDASDRPPDNLSTADTAVNIYSLNVTSYFLSIGSFASYPALDESDFASLQLWSGYSVTGTGPSDLFSIGVLRGLPSTSPVDLGAGTIDAVFGFNAFDFTATARSTDLITEQPALTAYGSQTASIGFYNTVTGLQMVSTINGLSASLTPVSAVPEPSSWTMMMMGLCAIALGIRRRRVTGDE